MEEESFVIELYGRIDSNNALEEEKRVMGLMEENSGKKVCFDASKLNYISSAGLRILLKAGKLSKNNIVIKDVSSEIYDIFETTGFNEIFDIRKRYRELSVEGCEVIGKGCYGTVYRLDDETVVKKYESPEALSMIENEKKLAKIAFVAGIPTAISFDIVKIGDTYGSVFELLKAKTMNDLIKENLSDADRIIKKYAELIKQVHGIALPKGTLPSAKEKFIGKLKNIRQLIPDSLFTKLTGFLNDLPDDNHLIHGDLQMKNIMLSDDEPMLIDMDTLSQGIPMFDLGGIYVAYKLFEEDEPGNTMRFFGISAETADRIMEGVLRNYYPGTYKETDLLDNIRIAAYIIFLDMQKDAPADDNLSKIRIEHAVEHLQKILYS